MVSRQQQYMLEFYKICTRQQTRDNAEEFLTDTVSSGPAIHMADASIVYSYNAVFAIHI